ncbi:hypothetical protein EV176_005519 [Coemansia sp. RSA 451]|nr:hypothetical protein EV176_005519 [Coemansia sp. RSA 451]KAJ2554802.1 hypothetical protein IWW35_001064 [Coemansia sp. RSA 1878]
MLRALSASCHSPLGCKWSFANSTVGTSRSITTKKSEAVKVQGTKTVANPLKAKQRRLVTSAQVLPDGYVKPALYDEHTPIPRCEAYPSTYHMGSFPWLLSAERQRTPMEDLEPAAVHSEDFALQRTNAADSAVSAAAGLLPLAARRHLAHALNMRIAQTALGSAAVDGVCDGASAVLPRVASLLSGASRGEDDATDELSRIFTAPLFARYMRDLDRLRSDHVGLELDVYDICSTNIRQLRTQTGPEAAFAALDGAAQVSSLRAGLTRQNFSYTNILGVTHAAPCKAPSSWSAAMQAAMGGRAPVRVRVDVELMVSMRYQLIGRHTAPSKHDRHNGTTKVVVDDDATRNLVLTLESSMVDGTDAQHFEWRVADIDYLLSSERRVQYELDLARTL